MAKQKLNMTLPEYEKVFRILHGVAAYANKGQPPSCLFYNVTGAIILSKIYGIDARPLMGAAFIKVNAESGFTLAFAESDFDSCRSSADAFHCWIETPSHILDFTSPIYSAYPNSTTLPNKMFQKEKGAMSGSQFELDSAGDFYFEPNLSLTRDRLQAGFQNNKFNDFAHISVEWAKLSAKKLLTQMKIQADDGEVIELKVSGINLVGAW